MLGLYELENLGNLDLSDNAIEEDESLVDFFQLIRSVTVIHLRGNPGFDQMDNSRKRIIAAMPHLYSLNDLPIRDVELVQAVAWVNGEDVEEAKRKYFEKLHANKVKLGAAISLKQKKKDALKR